MLNKIITILLVKKAFYALFNVKKNHPKLINEVKINRLNIMLGQAFF